MATLTIKNLPDEIYAALAKNAKRHRRSINNEVIVQLEYLNDRKAFDTEAQLARIRKLRDSIKGVYVTETDIQFAKNEGRP